MAGKIWTRASSEKTTNDLNLRTEAEKVAGAGETPLAVLSGDLLGNLSDLQEEQFNFLSLFGDSINNLLDLQERRISFFTTLAESVNNLADSQERQLDFLLPASSVLGTLADASLIEFLGSYGVSATETVNSWADSLGPRAATRVLKSDTLSLADELAVLQAYLKLVGDVAGNLQDGADTRIAFLKGLFDSIDNLQDETGVQTRFLKELVDDVGNLADAPLSVEVDYKLLGGDALGFLADSVENFLSEISATPISAETADNLNSWLSNEELKLGLLKLLADNLNNWSDSQELRVSLNKLLIDNLSNWLDDTNIEFTFRKEATDSLNNWLDDVHIATGLTSLVADTLSNWLDNTEIRLSLAKSLTDSLFNLTDDPNIKYSYLLEVVDNFLLSDNVSPFFSYLKEVGDDIGNLQDFVQTSTAGFTELLVQDSLENFNDLALVRLGYQINKGDTLTLADSTDRLFTYLKLVDDSISLQDVTTQLFNYLLAKGDSISLSDSIEVIRGYTRAVSDNMSLEDAVSGLLIGGVRQASDSMTIIDAISTFAAFASPVQDNMGTLSDNASQRLDYLLSIDPDNLDNWLDDVLAALGLDTDQFKESGDSILLTDSINVLFGYLFVADDQLVLSDSVQKIFDYFVLASEDNLNNWLDSVLVTVDLVTTPLSDILTFTDSIAVLFGYTQQIEDQFLLNDTVQKLLTNHLELTDQFTLTDNTRRLLTYVLSVEDNLNNWGDDLTLLLQSTIRDGVATDDLNSWIDFINVRYGLATSKSDQLSISDSLTLLLTQHVNKADTLSLSDSVNLFLTYFLAVSDQMILTDSVKALLNHLTVVDDSLQNWADDIQSSLDVIAEFGFEDNLNFFADSVGVLLSHSLQFGDLLTLSDSLIVFLHSPADVGDSLNLWADKLDVKFTGPFTVIFGKGQFIVPSQTRRVRVYAGETENVTVASTRRVRVYADETEEISQEERRKQPI